MHYDGSPVDMYYFAAIPQDFQTSRAYTIPVIFYFLISSLGRLCKSSSKLGRCFYHDQKNIPDFMEDNAPDTLYMACSSLFFHNAVLSSSLMKFSEVNLIAAFQGWSHMFVSVLHNTCSFGM